MLVSNGDGTATDESGARVPLTAILPAGIPADRFVASSGTGDTTTPLAATLDTGGMQALATLGALASTNATTPPGAPATPGGLGGLVAWIQQLSSGKKAALGIAVLLAVAYVTSDDSDDGDE